MDNNMDDNMDNNILVMYCKICKFVSHLIAMLRIMDDNMDDNIIVMYYKIQGARDKSGRFSEGNAAFKCRLFKMKFGVQAGRAINQLFFVLIWISC